MANGTHLLSISAVLILAMAAVCIAFVPESDAAETEDGFEYGSTYDSFSIHVYTLNGVTPYNNVKIFTKNGFMRLSSEAITDLKNLESDVVFKMTPLSNDDLDGTQTKEGYKKVSITLKDADGTDHPVVGSVTVYLPYKPGFLEVTDKISVKHIASDGSLTDMPAHYEDGYVVFETDHFSDFMVVPSYESYYGPLLNSLSILAILAVLLLASALVYLRHTQSRA